ncbi:MAG TPA: hypothetical protein VLF20_05900 [Patescibacteria group bacterium]|nr:hypothetical protein [Patescibacteria group bacterium]
MAVFFGIVMVFFPAWTNSGSPVSNTETIVSGVIVFFPQIIFLILLGIKYLRK